MSEYEWSSGEEWVNAIDDKQSKVRNSQDKIGPYVDEVSNNRNNTEESAANEQSPDRNNEEKVKSFVHEERADKNNQDTVPPSTVEQSTDRQNDQETLEPSVNEQLTDRKGKVGTSATEWANSNLNHKAEENSTDDKSTHRNDEDTAGPSANEQSTNSKNGQETPAPSVHEQSADREVTVGRSADEPTPNKLNHKVKENSTDDKRTHRNDQDTVTPSTNQQSTNNKNDQETQQNSVHEQSTDREDKIGPSVYERAPDTITKGTEVISKDDESTDRNDKNIINPCANDQPENRSNKEPILFPVPAEIESMECNHSGEDERIGSKTKRHIATTKEQSETHDSSSPESSDHMYSPLAKHRKIIKSSKSKQNLKKSVKQRRLHTVFKYSNDDFKSSDEDIPLTKLKSQIHEKRNNEADECDSDSFYDIGDSYKPSKDDYNSSDFNSSVPSDDSSNCMERYSDRDTYTKSQNNQTKNGNDRKKKNHNSIRREIVSSQPELIQESRQPCFSNKKQKSTEHLQNTQSANLSEIKDTSGAEVISKQDATFNELTVDHHKRKLDNLLLANGLERKPVAADGNCFFKSVLFHFPEVGSTNALRKALCEHMLDRATEYLGFFTISNLSESYDEDMAWIDFRTEIDALHADGSWTTRAADLLPLALANWSGYTVKIFSSLHQTILDIVPTINFEQNKNEPINLAYLASENNTIPEHYDACSRIGKTNTFVLDGSIGVEERELNKVKEPTSSHKECLMGSSANYIEETKTDKNDSVRAKMPVPNNDVEEQDILYTAEAILKTPEKPKKKRGRPKGTPQRKAANFITPPKKSLFRKKKATPEMWKRNVRQRLRLSGKEYISGKGKVIKEKTLKPRDCSQCTYKCSVNINEDQRLEIFKTFWSLESNDKKKDFIISNSKQKKTRTYLDDNDTPVSKKRHYYRSYFFKMDDEPITVCKKFFLATLGISESYVENALKNQSGGVFVGEDKRGKHTPHNKTSDKALKMVRTHIESFPVVDGHYTRKDSNRKYLGANLNITKMYQLYLEHYKEKLPANHIVTPNIYRKVFNEEYNFSFHVPKKDQCSLCLSYHREKANGTLSSELKTTYEEHQQRKINAREEKKKDKEKSKSSKDLFVATFDLQAVLQTPCSLVSQLNYMRKLSVYNFTIYNLANNNATCYLWSESDAQRGSCEISTCLQLQLLSLPANIKHAIFYFDACAGQNRNQFTSTCLLNAVITHPSIHTIDHKFLESGHTQMECDSMHAAIEFAKKKTEIYVPQQWSTVIRLARRKNPYMVVPIQFEDIIDYKDLTKRTMKYRKEDTVGRKINWLNIKWLRYTKNDPDNIQFKYVFEEDFRVMKVTPIVKCEKSSEITELPRKYKSKQLISAAKKKDLLTLCRTGVIPNEYHKYYKTLPSNNSVSDKLPDTDVEEDNVDSDQE